MHARLNTVWRDYRGRKTGTRRVPTLAVVRPGRIHRRPAGRQRHGPVSPANHDHEERQRGQANRERRDPLSCDPWLSFVLLGFLGGAVSGDRALLRRPLAYAIANANTAVQGHCYLVDRASFSGSRISSSQVLGIRKGSIISNRTKEGKNPCKGK